MAEAIETITVGLSVIVPEYVRIVLAIPVFWIGVAVGACITGLGLAVAITTELS